MKIFMIWVQRKCRYPGEYGPELLDSIDEWTDEDNPDYLDNKFKEYCTDSEFESVQIIEAEINDGTLQKIMSKENKIKLQNIREV